MRKTNLSYDFNKATKKWTSLFQKQTIMVVLFFCVIFFSTGSTLGQEVSQKIRITGQVVDNENLPLIGVSIVEVGTINGTVTDVNGNYDLTVTNNALIRYSYIGFKAFEKKVTSSSVVDVTLEAELSALGEVVVVGYGTQRKQDLTGAVAVVDMKEAHKLTSASISEMLQGQVAGVSIQSSGDPGSMGKINIRGIGSFSNVGPLYVIDGLIVNDVNHINPSDIESIQVLKDASSTAIYGSRGANGAIIVAQTNGRKSNPKLDVNATLGAQEIAKKIKMKNTNDFLYYNELAYLNAGLEWPGQPTPNTYLPNSDLQKAIFEVGQVQDVNLTYTQGSDNLSLMMGGGYFSQDGVLAGPKYERFTYRINTEGHYGILKIGESLTLSNANQKTTNYGSFTNALMMPPVLPIYDPNEPTGRGGFGYGTNAYPTYITNPVAQQASLDNKVVNNRIMGNIYLELKILKYITFKLMEGVDFRYGAFKTIDYAYTMRMG